MKVFKFALITLLSATLVRAQDAPAVPDSGVTARSSALQLAGAFANDGYRLRDGYWSGDIEPGKPLFVSVNLFAGNEYWFSAAVNPPGRKLAVAVFDSSGAPLEFQTHEDGAVAAAGFVPTTSGEYFVKLSLLEGEKAEFCFLYSYK